MKKKVLAGAVILAAIAVLIIGISFIKKGKNNALPVPDGSLTRGDIESPGRHLLVPSIPSTSSKSGAKFRARSSGFTPISIRRHGRPSRGRNRPGDSEGRSRPERSQLLEPPGVP